MTEAVNYRYPGSRPFQDTNLDRRLFYGREDEKKELLHRILSDNLVVLYAKSGIGKTSLLNAGVFEDLRLRGLIPLTVRLNDPEKSSTDFIYYNIENYKDYFSQNDIEYKPGKTLTLWHYFKTVEFWSKDDVLMTPVLVLDQFEELFTLYREEEHRKVRQKFIAQFADLARGRMPEILVDPQNSWEGSPAPPMVKILISIREDFLGDLEELSSEIPDILHNRFRLKKLTREQAKRAIEEPAGLEDKQIFPRQFSYEPEAVDAILNFLCQQREGDETIQADAVEPFQLQILCHHLERRVLEPPVQGEGQLVIKLDEVGNNRKMSQTMEDYFDDQLKRLDSRRKAKAVRKLCSKGGLISVNEKRLSLQEEEIKHRFNVTKDVLSKLIDYRLLRLEPRLGSDFYELSHDTLVEPILQSLQKRKRKDRKWIGVGVVLCIVPLSGYAYWMYSELIESEQARISSQKVAEGNLIARRVQYAERNYEADQDQYYVTRRVQYNEAINKYKEAIALGNNNANAYNHWGILSTELDRYEDALRHFSKAIEVDPDYAEAYYNLGFILRHFGRDEEAFEKFKKTVEVDSTYATRNYNGNIKLSELGQYEKKIKRYKTAVEANPNDANAYYKWGLLLEELERYGEALDKFKKAKMIFDNKPEMYEGDEALEMKDDLDYYGSIHSLSDMRDMHPYEPRWATSDDLIIPKFYEELHFDEEGNYIGATVILR